MRAGRAPLLLIVLALASPALGCYQSESPLDATPRSPMDSRLIGAWRCVGPDKSDDAITVTTVASANRMVAVTWEEPGKKPDHYEGYLVGLKGTTVIDLREVPATPTSQWSLVHLDFLQPDIALIKVVNETLLKGLGPAAIRATLEQQRSNAALYEKDPLVCIRAKR